MESEISSLFRVTSGLSGLSEDVKKILTDLSEGSYSVHCSDEIYDLDFIVGFGEVVDFIEGMDK